MRKVEKRMTKMENRKWKIVMENGNLKMVFFIKFISIFSYPSSIFYFLLPLSILNFLSYNMYYASL